MSERRGGEPLRRGGRGRDVNGATGYRAGERLRARAAATCAVSLRAPDLVRLRCRLCVRCRCIYAGGGPRRLPRPAPRPEDWRGGALSCAPERTGNGGPRPHVARLAATPLFDFYGGSPPPDSSAPPTFAQRPWAAASAPPPPPPPLSSPSHRRRRIQGPGRRAKALGAAAGGVARSAARRRGVNARVGRDGEGVRAARAAVHGTPHVMARHFNGRPGPDARDGLAPRGSPAN